MPAVITKDGSQDFIESLSSNLSCIKNTIETRQYSIYSTAMEEAINKDSRLSSSSSKLWRALRVLVNSSEDWSILISNASLAKKIDRSIWTVRRLLSELEQLGYIYRQFNHGKMSKIYVRFPQEFLDKIQKETKPRNRSKCTTPGINQRGQTSGSYYLYNTNNNNRDCTTVPTKKIESEIVVPAAQAEVERVAAKKEPKVDNQARIERLEIRKKEVLQEFDVAIKKKNYQKIRELGEIETSINLEIDRLKSILPTSKNINTNFTRRKISEIEWNKIHKEINSYNLNINVQRIMEEIDFSVRQGSLRFSKFNRDIENTVEHAWNIGLQLIREGKWQTPREMFRR